MKRCYFGVFVIITLFFFQSVQAQYFEFETVRTPQTPGFFMIRIFPLEGNKALQTTPVFVRNYAENKASLYTPLLPVIQEMGGRIIEKQDVSFYEKDPQYTIVFLGDQEKGYAWFRLSPQENPLESFEVFQENFLQDIVLRNIEVEFGGNVYDILPSYIPHVTKNPITLVGKFQKDQKTRFHIRGEISDGIIESTEFLPFDEKENGDIMATGIEDIWEQMWNEENIDPVVETVSSQWWRWNNSFPFLLFGLGVLFFAWGIRSIQKRRSFMDDLWDQTDLPSQKQLYHEIQKNETKKIPKESLPKDLSDSASPFVDIPQTRSDD